MSVSFFPDTRVCIGDFHNEWNGAMGSFSCAVEVLFYGNLHALSILMFQIPGSHSKSFRLVNQFCHRDGYLYCFPFDLDSFAHKAFIRLFFFHVTFSFLVSGGFNIYHHWHCLHPYWFCCLICLGACNILSMFLCDAYYGCSVLVAV